jgi:hypothetical protein
VVHLAALGVRASGRRDLVGGPARGIEGTDGEFAPRPGALLVAVHGGKLARKIAKDQGELLRPLWRREQRPRHPGRERIAAEQHAGGFIQRRDARGDAPRGLILGIGKRARDEIVARTPHAQKVDLGRRDFPR